MIPSLLPLLDRLKSIWPDLVPQWSSKSLTIIVRREDPDLSMPQKLFWAYNGTTLAAGCGNCVYTSFNANLRVASFSVMYWAEPNGGGI